MSGGLYNRVTVWGATQVLTAAALNAEFDNVLNNFIPQMMGSYSATVAQMQIETSPGGIGTESLATSLAGELERIRFVLAEIIGQTYWYQTPVTSLSQLNSALGAASLANKISSGQTNGTAGSTQPNFLVPSGSATTVTLNAVSVPLVYSIAGASYTISANVAVTSLTTAPAVNNTAVVNDTSMSAQSWTKIAGEYGSVITLSNPGSLITGLAGQISAFKNQTSGEFFVGRVIAPVINSVTTYQLTECRRGYFYGSAGTPVARAGVTNGDVIQVMKLTWIFATAAGSLAIVYDNPSWGTVPSSPNIGDYWFDFTVNYWKIYSGTAFVSAAATLIGVCIQDTSHTVGARSFDFFEGYSALNTAELILDQTAAGEIRNRFIGCQVSVYGTALQVNQGYLYWTAGANNVSGVTISAGNFYYMYIDLVGNTLIDSIAPYDRRSDLLGFYHPNQTWRCLGYAFANGSNTFSQVETFYRNDTAGSIQPITAASPANPLPDLIHTTQNYFTIDTTGGAYSQTLPPVAQYRGQTISYMKISTDMNICTLTAFEPVILTTTGNWTQGSATPNIVTGLAATTGLTAGLLVKGSGIPRGTFVTTSTGATATLSQPVFTTQTTAAVTFGQTGGIQNNITFPVISPFEFISLFSTGTQWIVKEHSYPQDWTAFPNMAAGVFITGSVSNPSYHPTVNYNVAKWRREGASARIVWDYLGSGSGAGAGSGQYYINIPSAIGTIDLTQIGTYSGANSGVAPYSSIGSAFSALVAGGQTNPELIYPFPFSSTQVAAAVAWDFQAAGLQTFWGSANGNPFGNSTTVGMASFNLLLPITGWIG